MRAHSSPLAWALLCGLAIAAGACRREDRPQPAAQTASAAGEASAAAIPPLRRQEAPARDLSIDESMGGHTLARHVGKSDAELAERLRREPQISSASTYTDRETAERTVGAALAGGGSRLDSWASRAGPRPNLVLHFVDAGGRPVGRSLSRTGRRAVDTRRALVVLRWQPRSGRFYVLTSYPEADR